MDKSNHSSRTGDGSSSVPNSPKGIPPLRNILHRASSLPHPQPSIPLASPKPRRTTPAVGILDLVTEHLKGTPPPFVRQSSPMLTNPNNILSRLNISNLTSRVSIERVSTASPEYPINQDSDGVAADYSVTILTELIGAPYLGDRTSEAAITALTGERASFRVSKDDHDITMNNFRRSISLESLATKASTTPCMLPMPSSRPYYDLSDSLESIPQHAWVMPYIIACTPPEILGQLLDLPFLVEGMSNTPAALVVAARLRARTISYDTAPTIENKHNSTSNTTTTTSSTTTTTVHRTIRSLTTSAEPPAYIPQSINNTDDNTSDDRNFITRRRSSTHTGAVYQPDYVLPADYYTTHIRTPSQQLFKIQLNHNITSSNTATACSSSSSRDPFAVHNKNIVSNAVSTSSASNSYSSSGSNSIAIENNELDIKTHSLQPLPKHKLSTTLPYRGSSKTPPPLQPQRVKFPYTWRSLGTVWLSQDPKWGSWNPKIVFLLDNYLLECTPTGTAVVGYTQLTNAKIVKIALGDTHGIGRRHTSNSSSSGGNSGSSSGNSGSSSNSNIHRSYSATRLATTATGIRGSSGSGNIHQVVAIEPPLLPSYDLNNATTNASNSNSPTGFELTSEHALPLNTTSLPAQQQPPPSPAKRETSPSPMYGIKITCAATSNPAPITAQSNAHTFWLTASNEYALDQIVLALTTAASLTMEDVFEVQRSSEDENIALLGRGRFNEVRLARRQLTRNLFQPTSSITTSAQPSTLNSPRQHTTTTTTTIPAVDIVPGGVRSRSSTNAPDYLVPDPFTTTSTVSNSSTHSPTVTAVAGAAEINTLPTTTATTTTHYFNRSGDGFDSPNQSSFISVSSTDEADLQSPQQQQLQSPQQQQQLQSPQQQQQLQSPQQEHEEDVFACRKSIRKIKRDSLDSPDLRCSNSRIQDYHNSSSTTAVNPFSTTSNPFSAPSLEPTNPFSTSSLEPSNPFSVPSLLQYSSSNQNSPAERYDSALPKLNLTRALERVDTEGFPLSDCDSSRSSSDSSSSAAENTTAVAVAETTTSSSTGVATTDIILPHTNEETNDRFSGWELQYCCALKVVSKEIFWGRVQTGRERGDALVREVLAQMLIATHYADHPKLILHSEYNVQPYLNKYEYNSHHNNTNMVGGGQYNEQTTRDIENTEIGETGNTEIRDTGNPLPTTTTTTSTTTTTTTTTTTPHRHLPIVQLLSAFETPQGFAIELQLMQSIDLFDLLSEVGIIPEYHVQCIIAQLIEAVSLCNTLGIAHRDIKLSNICFSMYQYNSHSVQSLLQSKTPIKIHLADFGMSGFIGSDKQLRGRCGTPGYVAPDILNADTNASYGLNIDIFSIAVVAYTLLCGYEPFGGSDTQDLLRANRAAEYKFHSPEWDSVSTAGKDWIAAALQPTTTSRISIEKSKEHDWLVEYFSGTSSGSSTTATDSVEKDSIETHSCILC